MSLATKPRVSEAEFLCLPETLDRVELLDGEVVVSPSPTFWHQDVLRRLVVALSKWADGRSDVTVAQAPLDVRFRANRILQPDAMIFLARLPRDQDGPIDRVPEICIEVLSSNRVYDRITKRFVYGEAGVVEYWVVEPAGFIERWSGPGLVRDEVLRDRLTTPLLVGFELDISALFS